MDRVARLDVPELLLSLDRYPYGCAEQVASRLSRIKGKNVKARLLED